MGAWTSTWGCRTAPSPRWALITIPSRRSRPGRDLVSAPALGDANGARRLHLVLGGGGGGLDVRLRRQDGPFDNGGPEWGLSMLALGDVSGDGRLDLALGGQDGSSDFQ
ncbi:unnamed protein product [Prorocentrum cordatum]|uniref:VCBS repeat-containing protein n=1 Tax=Prorocentrum cordatum TaxID=2364126 RepID=A0ABN9S2E5_9DINO|nr:unnamed protein product [Polarella glacialis]